ncbi:hypothetical protein OFC18_30185, partial [Escherichia coli]|nr:hypothetical protein [Escherichia coli]
SRLALQRLELGETEKRIEQLRESLASVDAVLESATAAREKESRQLAEAVEKLAETRSAADRASALLAEANMKSAEAMNARAAVEVRRT